MKEQQAMYQRIANCERSMLFGGGNECHEKKGYSRYPRHRQGSWDAYAENRILLKQSEDLFYHCNVCVTHSSYLRYFG